MKLREVPWDSAMSPFYYSSYIQAVNKSYQFYFQKVPQICPFLPISTAHAIAVHHHLWPGTLQQPPNCLLHCNSSSPPAHSPQNSQSDG